MAAPCLACGTPDPPPEPTCRDGMDHYVGTVHGCPHCGRTLVACALVPCTPETDAQGP